jgi:hypothetical protein
MVVTLPSIHGCVVAVWAGDRVNPTRVQVESIGKTVSDKVMQLLPSVVTPMRCISSHGWRSDVKFNPDTGDLTSLQGFSI